MINYDAQQVGLSNYSYSSSYGIEELSNGYIRVFDYGAKVFALLNEDGSFRSGDIRPEIAERVYQKWLKEQGLER